MNLHRNKNIAQELKANTFRIQHEGVTKYVIDVDKVFEILDL